MARSEPVGRRLATQARVLRGARVQLIRGFHHTKDRPDLSADGTPTMPQVSCEQASHVQRIQKTLEDADLKLASVLADIMGQSGRAVLAALAAGETDPERLRALVGARVKASPEVIRAALTGRPGPHHRFLLGLHLGQIEGARRSRRRHRRRGGARPRPFPRGGRPARRPSPRSRELTAEVVLAGSRPSRWWRFRCIPLRASVRLPAL